MTMITPHSYTVPLDFARSWARVVRGQTPLPPTREAWLSELAECLPAYSPEMDDYDHPLHYLLGAVEQEHARLALNDLGDNIAKILTRVFNTSVSHLNALLPKAKQLTRDNCSMEIESSLPSWNNRGSIVVDTPMGQRLSPNVRYTIGLKPSRCRYSRQHVVAVPELFNTEFFRTWSSDFPLMMAAIALTARVAHDNRSIAPLQIAGRRNSIARTALFSKAQEVNARIRAVFPHIHGLTP